MNAGSPAKPQAEKEGNLVDEDLETPSRDQLIERLAEEFKVDDKQHPVQSRGSASLRSAGPFRWRGGEAHRLTADRMREADFRGVQA